MDDTVILQNLSATEYEGMLEASKKKPGYTMTGEEAVQLSKALRGHSDAIMSGKRRDYSGTEDPFRNLRSAEALGVEPWRGTFVRLMDKISRIRSITEAGGSMAVEESLVDTFADIHNYTDIAAGLVWEELGLEVPNAEASDS
jgi:hypothetical protein